LIGGFVLKMSKKTAFGGDNNYRYFKSKGARITRENDFVALKEWRHRLWSERTHSCSAGGRSMPCSKQYFTSIVSLIQKELNDLLKKKTFIPQALGVYIDYLPKFLSMKNTKERRLIFFQGFDKSLFTHRHPSICNDDYCQSNKAISQSNC
jgi:hypothetical protein